MGVAIEGNYRAARGQHVDHYIIRSADEALINGRCLF